jgi:hypothetical protein
MGGGGDGAIAKTEQNRSGFRPSWWVKESLRGGDIIDECAASIDVEAAAEWDRIG